MGQRKSGKKKSGRIRSVHQWFALKSILEAVIQVCSLAENSLLTLDVTSESSQCFRIVVKLLCKNKAEGDVIGNF